jgi:hypothetical protein
MMVSDRKKRIQFAQASLQSTHQCRAHRTLEETFPPQLMAGGLAEGNSAVPTNPKHMLHAIRTFAVQTL